MLQRLKAPGCGPQSVVAMLCFTWREGRACAHTHSGMAWAAPELCVNAG